MQYKDYAPKVCHDCRFLDGEPGEFGTIVSVYCNLNLYLPTKKGTCKRKQPNKAWKGQVGEARRLIVYPTPAPPAPHANR